MCCTLRSALQRASLFKEACNLQRVEHSKAGIPRERPYGGGFGDRSGYAYVGRERDRGGHGRDARYHAGLQDYVHLRSWPVFSAAVQILSSASCIANVCTSIHQPLWMTEPQKVLQTNRVSIQTLCIILCDHCRTAPHLL